MHWIEIEGQAPESVATESEAVERACSLLHAGTCTEVRILVGDSYGEAERSSTLAPLPTP